jgi:hypothetical protein
MPNIRCKTCGLMVQVPEGGRRLCGCGTWLSGAGDEAELLEPIDGPAVAAVPAVPVDERWPRIDSDVAAIERLNEGYRRIRKELSKAIVGQERVPRSCSSRSLRAVTVCLSASPAWPKR